MAKHDATGTAKGQPAKINGTPKVSQAKVASKVAVSGKTTTRTYSDGAVQHNTWPSEKHAKDYAASVREQGA